MIKRWCSFLVVYGSSLIKPFVIFRKFRDIDRLVIGDPFKPLRAQRPFFSSFFSFLIDWVTI